MRQRIKWIDVAKGILIILVVLGHTHLNTFADMAINSFHMAAFFALSGFTLHFEEEKSFKALVERKCKTIIAPYLAFSAILLIYQYAKAFIVSERSFDLISGLISVVVPVSGRSSTTVYGLWFLPCLFLSELLAFWIIKPKKTSVRLLLFIVLTTICVSVHIILKIPSIVSILPIAVAFILAGYIMMDKIELLRRISLCITAILLFAVSAGVNYLIVRHTVDLSSMTLGNIPLYLLSCIGGSFAVCSVACFIEKSKLLQILGKDSLYYYGLHYEVLSVVAYMIPSIPVGGGTANSPYIYNIVPRFESV